MKLPFTRARQDRDPKPSNDSGIPPLSRWERLGAGAIVIGGAAVGGFGFFASFDAVSLKAADWGFSEPWVLPTAIDSAIPVFTGAYLLLIRMGMPLWWARIVPWALSLVTCALNVAAGTSLWSKVAHGAMSLLWVAVSEIAAHVYAVRIGAATGRKMDKVRWARWFLSPGPTFLLWRRMKLWELRSYDQVLKLEQERLVYQAQLRGRFGRAWRRKAPVASLLPLQLVSAGVPLAETAPAGLRAAGLEPTGIFAEPVEPVEELQALPAPPAPRPTPVPAATARRSRQVTATVPARPEAPKNTPEPAEPAAAHAENDNTEEQADAYAPLPATENELYGVVVAALEQGQLKRFNQGGDLTGAAIGRALGQTAQNGRKVRNRLLTRYAAHLSDQGIPVPENFGPEDLAKHLTTTTTA
ncbi:DUF2637 domain-containing protein [Streptomyces griseomycini]|uniref:DUF2637 domain-containing protein n=1 Tax=Streptomyces griseomycini TaxID=66895 RepID=A0A7W7PW92_9ACTN|nr:DUF2637 domain-containing protein [Streptomyces griseomycini]MBB4902495.1 hypothetical protein [Streptomyces griseomycini]GGR52040.1 hypothetical protein GCM10015536_66870 [Streptomyces griseomycini]